MVDETVVEVLTAQVRVTGGRPDFENVLPPFTTLTSGSVNLRPMRRFASKTRGNAVALGDERAETMAERVCDDKRAEKRVETTRGLRGCWRR